MNPTQSSQKLVFSAENLKKVEWLKSRYPTARAALLPTLYLAQAQFGHVSTAAMDCVADALGIPAIWVYEAATFYTMYHREKPGKTCINVCTSIACFLRGSDDIVNHLTDKLGIEPGETTKDGKFTLATVECLAWCDHAPMAQVNEDYVGLMTRESCDELIRKSE